MFQVLTTTATSRLAKRVPSFVNVALLALVCASAYADEAPKATVNSHLIISSYDSFVAKGGLGPEILPLFEKAYPGCTARAVSGGDGGQLVNRLQIEGERKRPTAHVVLGLDQNTWERAKPWIESWGTWKPKGFEKVRGDLKIENGFMPFDYGVFALMSDREQLAGKGVPKSLKDLLKPEWKRSIVLEDPRSSTPGLAFLLYTKEVLGEPAAWDFWKSLKSQWLTIAPGWDQAYGLFLKKEAPLVWSYTTSQAYHEEHGDKKGTDRRYAAVLFDEGQPVQVEGAALVKGNPHRCARSFLEFLLTDEVQTRVMKKNWMLPVTKSVQLPESFRALPQPKKLVQPKLTDSLIKNALQKWSQAVEGSK